MVGTTMVNKELLDRLRAAFRRYGMQVLDDPDITVDFFASELGMHLDVVLGSPKFQSMSFGEEDDSVWDFLHADPEMTKDDLALILQIRMEPEHVEFI
jgi:stress-induced morphogen